MRFRLRTQLIVLALGPPVLALVWSEPELAIPFSILAGAIAAIAYWPRICGKGG